MRQRLPLRIQAARVAGVDIPNQKRIEFSLQYIFGIGPTTAKAILVDTVRALPVVWTGLPTGLPAPQPQQKGSSLEAMPTSG